MKVTRQPGTGKFQKYSINIVVESKDEERGLLNAVNTLENYCDESDGQDTESLDFALKLRSAVQQ